jgi:hypothetical protein
MMQVKGFKAEVFFTIPITFLIFGLVCTSLITQEWVSGRALIVNEDDFQIKYNFGLFKGEKVRTRSGTNAFPLASKFFIFLRALKIGLFYTLIYMQLFVILESVI